MSSLAERLDSIRVRVTVPGTDISAELRDRDKITVHFGQRVYGGLSEKDLEHYLGTLARLLYVNWVRQYHQARGDDFGQAEPTQADRDYLAARAEMVALGQSPDGRIRITSRGMQSVQIQISNGTVHALSEVDFTDAVNVAVSALISDHLAKIQQLKRRFYE